jgi:peptidylprolyl isomerase
MLSSRAAATRRPRFEARMTFFSRRAFLAVSLVALAAPALAEDDVQNTLILTTKNGKIVIRLWPKVAPKTVAQIKALVKRKFYDGQVFHRVIPGFMAQTGDPTGTGSGGSDLPDIPAEFNAKPFKRGTVGMARASDPDSANSQFFICLGDADFLDGKYTAFGEVVSGMEVVDQIKAGTQDNNGAVDQPDKMISLRLGGADKAKPKPKASDAPADAPADAPNSQD